MIGIDVLSGSGADIDAFVVIGGLLGGLAIFLLGMEQMTEALRLVAGERLRGLLLKLTKNRFAGLLSGAGQDSSAARPGWPCVDGSPGRTSMPVDWHTRRGGGSHITSAGQAWRASSKYVRTRSQ